MSWQNPAKVQSTKYICGHCKNDLVSREGYHSPEKGTIFLCHYCDLPTFISKNGGQFPGSIPGYNVENIDSKIVADLYEESRNCMAVNANTASILCSRKLLMNIAVSEGASEGLRFIEYVEYLNANGYIPPKGKAWVDKIRVKGNEATHEIAIKTRLEAEELIIFVGILLKFIYEFPAKMNSSPDTINETT